MIIDQFRLLIIDLFSRVANHADQGCMTLFSKFCESLVGRTKWVCWNSRTSYVKRFSDMTYDVQLSPTVSLIFLQVTGVPFL